MVGALVASACGSSSGSEEARRERASNEQVAEAEANRVPRSDEDAASGGTGATTLPERDTDDADTASSAGEDTSTDNTSTDATTTDNGETDDTAAGDTTLDDETAGAAPAGEDTEPAPVAPPEIANLPEPAECGDSAWLETSAGLNSNGTLRLDDAEVAAMAHYRLALRLEPETGALVGSMRAELPASDADYGLRLYAGLSGFDTDITLGPALVDGEDAAVTRDASLIEIAGTGDGQAHEVELSWSYFLPEVNLESDPFGGLSGDQLKPSDIGLLGRYPGGAQLGHWFPVLLGAEVRDDADPDGFGDIGAFPAAAICATIDVPEAFEVITGGVRLSDDTADGRRTVSEAAVGIRDLGVAVRDDVEVTEEQVGEVAVRVWHPDDLDAATVDEVLDESVTSVVAIEAAFGPYPWTELEVISTPLGSGVGGMEWPGAIWIERTAFEGGIPGFDLDLGGLDLGGIDIGDLLGGGLAIDTLREWTIAHEVGHEWWHAVVGNDSVGSPSVDEPLAQFAACVAMKERHPDNWRAICEAQTTEVYSQYRGLGVADAPADQASDAFDSSLQYGAIVYGKAPGFYLAAADLMGWDELVDALATFVESNDFDLVATGELREHLGEAFAAQGNDRQTMLDLWDRWFSGTFGDEDLGVDAGLGGLDLGGLGLDDGVLDGMDLEGMDLEGMDLEGMDLEGMDLEDLNFQDLGLGVLTEKQVQELLDQIAGAGDQ
jgi:hypothetical protein